MYIGIRLVELMGINLEDSNYNHISRFKKNQIFKTFKY